MNVGRTLFRGNLQNRTRMFAHTQRGALPFLRTHATRVVPGSSRVPIFLLAAFGVSLTGIYEWIFGATPVDYEAVRKDIAAILEDPKYDDGSYGPVLVRLAWHAAGTYDIHSKTGGSDGATMRFSPESGHGANAGLDLARSILNPIQAKYPGLSHADLWILAGCVAIEEMGGPKVEFRPGRTDKPDGSYCPPDGRLPDASQGAAHVRAVFNRQGFSDQEMVALIGAHCLGRCHTTRSGFDGPWTHSPITFSNDYFIQLLERKWTKRNWNGPFQYADESGTLMMLPADIALIEDPEFKKWVQIYAKDEERFFNDFAKAFQKLLENGATNLKACPVTHK